MSSAGTRPAPDVLKWIVPIEAVRRVGVLTALADEGDGAAVALGDVAAHHVRLRSDGLVPAFGAAPSGFVPWRQVRELDADIPATWVPAPAVMDVVGPLLEGVFGGSGSIAETPTFPVRIVADDGARLEWRATPHYLSGYRRRDAAVAARLLAHLVARADARILLSRPHEMLGRLAQILPKT
ncbi:hypothetical protein GCM10017591_12750 [Microbacterium dextranolyticum]|uniref:Uncharacterized protein n=1 Tax=Microbacterium dextranolyticum TaxID=36806 RepID=A0A9W6HLF9_9MICO|nr:hypothetical protein GCM10017591_12750 [Microbacterium dextranolyticum]